MTDTAEKLAWTDERDATLRRLWAVNMTADGIANNLGGSATKNSVIGRAGRLGLERRPPGPRPAAERAVRAEAKPAPVTSPKQKPKPIAPAVKAAAKPTPPPAPKPAPVALPPVAALPRVTCFDPGTRTTIGLVDLCNGVCRWPFDLPGGTRYCGDPTAEPANPLVVYCRAHAALAYTATKARAA